MSKWWGWLGTAAPPTEKTDLLQRTEIEDISENISKTDECTTTTVTTAVGEESSRETNNNNAPSPLGSYLYSFATNTASKLKETVSVQLDKSIIGEFTRENENFLREIKTIEEGVPPWVGSLDETSMKRQILALSSDERNFLRCPPSGVKFTFDLEHSMPVALAMLKEDENLAKIRFRLVPKRIAEEKFWCNYFYRVSLVKHATELSISGEEVLMIPPEEALMEPLDTPAIDINNNDITEKVSTEELLIDSSSSRETVTSSDDQEFVSDTYQVNETLTEEERNLLMTTEDEEHTLLTEKEEWEIEKELQDEIDSYELVDDENDDENWEREIEDLIELDSLEKS